MLYTALASIAIYVFLYFAFPKAIKIITIALALILALTLGISTYLTNVFDEQQATIDITHVEYDRFRCDIRTPINIQIVSAAASPLELTFTLSGRSDGKVVYKQHGVHAVIDQAVNELCLPVREQYKLQPIEELEEVTYSVDYFKF